MKGNTGKCLYLFTSSSCFLPWDRQHSVHFTCFWHIPVSHMYTRQVPSTSHPCARTKMTCFYWEHWKTEVPATVLRDWDEQFLLSWTGIFAHSWRREGKPWRRGKKFWLFVTHRATGGRRNTTHKAQRNLEAHTTCWDCVYILVTSHMGGSFHKQDQQTGGWDCRSFSDSPESQWI